MQKNGNNNFHDDNDIEEENDNVDDLRASKKTNQILRFTTVKDSKYDERSSRKSISKTNLVKFTFKIILLGNFSVGKTSIFNHFVFSQMNYKTEATIIPNIQTKTLNLDENTIICLQICDTCGEEQTKTIGKSFYRDVHGALLIFDTTNEDSFNDLDYWVNEVNNHASQDTILSLGGNKSDLKKERAVSYNDAFNYSKKLQMDYYDISAKTGNNIYLLFEILTSRMHLKYEQGGYKKQKNQKGRITLSNQEHIQKGQESITKKKKCCK